jgi:hypothetical protein
MMASGTLLKFTKCSIQSRKTLSILCEDIECSERESDIERLMRLSNLKLAIPG